VPKKDEIERQCALTREVRPAAELIRFVVGPDDVLVPDVDARAEGRGVWVTASEAMVAEAQKKKAFARSLRTSVTVPDDLAGLTRRRLEERLLGSLGLARKAGQVVTGATRVRQALDKGEASALITATDAASDGRDKMAAALKGLQNGGTTPHFELLSSAQLGLALGLENVIHAALTNGAAARSALARAERLARFIAPRDSV
jgi:predicted RNA-binding protein YlxR (DUF448 family)